MTASDMNIPRHIILKHDDDAIEVSSSNDSDAENTKPALFRQPLPRNLPLVDEIDLQQVLISPSQPWKASAIQGIVIGKEQLEVICKKAATTNDGVSAGNSTAGVGNKPQACPCCRRFIHKGGDIDSGDDASVATPHTPDRHRHATPEESKDSNESNTTLTSLVHAAVTTLTMQPTTYSSISWQPMAAPPLATGDEIKEYTIKQTIVQGWLYKKGTGADFSGRRWWKPRWVTLALAESSNTIIPAPILISHRAPGVPYPASIVELTESTVIMAVERAHINSTTYNSSSTGGSKSKHQHEQTETPEWNRHCFQIVHTKATTDSSTRIFTAPFQDRNEWVFAINNALIDHEKRLSKVRSDAARNECIEMVKQAKKSKPQRAVGWDNASLLDCELEEEERQTPWTTNISDVGSRSRRTISPSPIRTNNSFLGLPPTNPRRRSPSPTIRMARSLDLSTSYYET